MAYKINLVTLKVA